MNIKDDLAYMEGAWVAQGLPKHIEKSTYATVKGAIAIKEKLIETFEKEFGYSPDMDVTKFDYNYAYNYGILDKLKELDANGTT